VNDLSRDHATIEYEVRGSVATLTLNRPRRRNAIDRRMRSELAAAVASIRQDQGLRSLILRGAGGAFCAGGDIREMSPVAVGAEAARDRMRSVHTWIEGLLKLDFPVIAVVDGPAYGAGFSLALAADFVIATPSARFCMPFLRLGLIPDLGSLYTLPRVVGVQRAREIIYSMREIGASEARDIGVVFEIHEPAAALQRAQELANSFAQASPVALSLTKRALATSLNTDLATVLDTEASGQAIARNTDYHLDAVNAFLEKRPPTFRWHDATR
jgi:2-(1,2-epoxy-1,2-dihydrophenyl)acetyl-CoA isomerase